MNSDTFMISFYMCLAMDKSSNSILVDIVHCLSEEEFTIETLLRFSFSLILFVISVIVESLHINLSGCINLFDSKSLRFLQGSSHGMSECYSSFALNIFQLFDKFVLFAIDFSRQHIFSMICGFDCKCKCCYSDRFVHRHLFIFAAKSLINTKTFYFFIFSLRGGEFKNDTE